MRKIIASINMTIDGVCDHTAGLPDEEIHQHYTELLDQADTILYGRITYQLMEFWRTLIGDPSDKKSMNDFAIAINKIPKVVFSHSLKDVEWDTARLSHQGIEAEVSELRQQPGKDILIGSRSLIKQLMKVNLVDELQLCVHPVVAAGGMLLFDNTDDRTILKLTNTKIFRGGAIMLYYEPANKETTNH